MDNNLKRVTIDGVTFTYNRTRWLLVWDTSGHNHELLDLVTRNVSTVAQYVATHNGCDGYRMMDLINEFNGLNDANVASDIAQ